jgi:D-amino-acid dehydrogenase
VTTSGSPDVLVIGAGVIGSTIAYELTQRGAKVLVVDKGAGVGSGCSYANAGLLSPSHVEPLATPGNLREGVRSVARVNGPFYVRPAPSLAPWLAGFVRATASKRLDDRRALMSQLAEESLALHLAYPGLGVATGVRQSGSLDVYLRRSRLKHGRPPKASTGNSGEAHLSQAAARQVESALGRIAGAVWHRRDAYCSSQTYMQAMLDAATAAGARIRWQSHVSALQQRGGHFASAEINGEIVKAGSVVLAAGLESARLAALVGVSLPLQPGKGYVVDVLADGEVPTLPTTIKDARIVATPYPDRLRICGTMGLGTTSAAISRRRVAGIRRAAASAFPRMQVRKTLEIWVGFRPCLPDGAPAVGTAGMMDNLHVAAGHGMWGLILAPRTAQIIADGVEGTTGAGIPDLLDPDRFARGPGPTSNSRHSPNWLSAPHRL